MRGLGARAVRTLVAIAVLFVIGVGYLLFGVVQIDPFHQSMVMTVNLARSGGLLDHSQVSYRGFPVGRVREILLRPDGVRVTIGVDEGTRIPVDTDVAIADLSAAGEQYLDFRPRTDKGPYLADGAVIDQRDTSIPVPFSQVISQVSRLAQQVDPVQANAVVNELAKAFDGSAPDIQRVIDGGDYLLAGLEETLPNTVNALGNGRVVLQTVSDLRGRLVDLGPHARDFTATVRDADPTVRDLVEDSPETLALIEDVVKKNGPSVATLLGDLGTSTHVMAQRLPALGEFLPSLSTLGPAAKAVVHNGQIGVLLDLYPRPTCDYGTPRQSPTIGGSPPPRIHRYCEQQGPRLQQRGAANVPRPHGDDTGTAPKGADPEGRAKDPGGR
ncbi:MAG TPA: MCE family protein [Pseudonocardia sp.]|nr:MCE family protein [Pseudonocardia sp.]